MDGSLNRKVSEVVISDFILKLSQIISHSIGFRPELITEDINSRHSKRQYLLPMLISDPLKLSGGCLPNFVIESYKKALNNLNIKISDENDSYCLTDSNFKKIYMNRKLSILEYNRLNKVIIACFYALYKCILMYDELKKSKRRKNVTTSRYIDTSPHVNFKMEKDRKDWSKVFQEHLFLTENRFSRIFKSFVGVTFKEYESFCFQTLNKNYPILRTYIQLISNMDYVIDHNVWKNLARKILDCDKNYVNKKNIFSNINDFNITCKSTTNTLSIGPENLDRIDLDSIGFIATNHNHILLSEHYSLQNYNSSDNKRNRKNTKKRKQLLLEKIPIIEPEPFEKYKLYLIGLKNVENKEQLRNNEVEYLEARSETNCPKFFENNTPLATGGFNRDTSDYHSNNQESNFSKSFTNIKGSYIPLDYKQKQFINENKISDDTNTPYIKDYIVNLLIAANRINKNYNYDNINFNSSYRFASLSNTNLQNSFSNGYEGKKSVTNIDNFVDYTAGVNATNNINNDKQNHKQTDSSFQAAYKAFCSNCGRKTQYNDTLESSNNNNYKKMVAETFNNYDILNKSVKLPSTNSVETSNLVSCLNVTASDIVRDMLFHQENTDKK